MKGGNGTQLTLKLKMVAQGKASLAGQVAPDKVSFSL